VIFLVALGVAWFWLDGPWQLALVAAAAVVELAETYFWWWLSHRRPAAVGVETLVGRRGVVTVPCRPEGQVRVAGEIWRARCEPGAETAAEVEVVGVDGLTLAVTPTGRPTPRAG
jgi:membrane protein implicated in regulation of membrane protease activity